LVAVRTTCTTYGDLGAYVLGALEPEQADAVRAHLDSCQLCRDEVLDLAWIPPLLSLVCASADESPSRRRRPVRVQRCVAGRSTDEG
jgi:anti-sigma factor RsiW